MDNLWGDIDLFELVDVEGVVYGTEIYLDIDSSFGTINVGDLATGGTSGATGIVVRFISNDLVELRGVVGSFVNESVTTSAGGFAIVDKNNLSIGSDSIAIYEPEGMDKANIRLQRAESHGVDFDFFDAESELIFDKVKVFGEPYSGYGLINAIYTLKGSDSVIVFKYYRSSSPELIYESRLLMSSRTKMDYGYRARAKRVDFDNDFKNLYNTKVDINKGVNYVDGSSLSLSFQDIILTPQAIQRHARSSNKGEEQQALAEPTGALVWYIVPNLGNSEYSSFKKEINSGGTYAYEDAFITTPTLANSTELLATTPVFEIDEFGVYSFDAEFTFEFSFTNSGGNDQSFAVRVVVYNPGSGVFEHISTSSNDNNTPEDTLLETTLSVSISNRAFNKGDHLYIVVRGDSWEMPILRTTSGALTIDAITKSGYTATKYLNLNSYVSKAFEAITGVSAGINSDFLDDQNAAMLSGRLVRNFPSSSPFYSTFSEIHKSLEAMFGLGFFVSKPGGTETLTISPVSDMYQDKEIMHFNSGVSEFEISTDKDLIINEVEIGYKGYSKGAKTALLSNSLNDFLSVHTYKTPIKQDKKKATYLSHFIASGNLIEEGSEQFYALYGEESWEHDDDIFIIAIVDQDTVYGQSLVISQTASGTPNDYLITIKNYLPQAVGQTEVVISIGVSTYDFDIVSVDADQELNQTTIVATSSSSYGVVSGVGAGFDLEFNNTWKAPESDEAFDTFTGFTDNNATYNARYNQKYMLAANSPVLNSGLYFKEPTDEYKLVSFKNSSNGVVKFKVGEDYSTLDPTLKETTIGSDIAINQVNNGSKLWIPELIYFECRVSFTDIMYIREAYNNSNLDDVNYGYISVTDYDGVKYMGFLKSMDYNPMTEMCKFVLIRKTEPVYPGSASGELDIDSVEETDIDGNIEYGI